MGEMHGPGDVDRGKVSLGSAARRPCRERWRSGCALRFHSQLHSRPATEESDAYHVSHAIPDLEASLVPDGVLPCLPRGFAGFLGLWAAAPSRRCVPGETPQIEGEVAIVMLRLRHPRLLVNPGDRTAARCSQDSGSHALRTQA